MAIIFILYAFSGENGTRTYIYDDFLGYNKPRSKLAAGNELPVQPETDSSPAETFHDKHIVFPDNANSPAHDDGTVSSISERTASPIPLERVAPVTEKALREKRYRRAKSEKLELRILETTKRELRRTETGICRELVRSGEEPARRSSSYPPEELSTEEFNRWVEAYIADKKEVQREEYKEERRKESLLALTTQNWASIEHQKEKKKKSMKKITEDYGYYSLLGTGSCTIFLLDPVLEYLLLISMSKTIYGVLIIFNACLSWW